ncbi:MAG: hypothetical protein EOP34_02005 [Rickettsiales bacterium]|nr:MAG: hypothetical protein EOP34_02005 [Rickettsiales bacterium]
MVIFSIFYLLFTNALQTEKKKSVFYSRVTLLTLLCAGFICYNNLFVLNLEKGVGLYGGIFNISSLSQSFNIFILLITPIILIFNSFFHRLYSTNTTSKIQILLSKKNTFNFLGLGDTKFGQYMIIEYPLIILFVTCGAVFLMSSGDLISIFVSIELQSYGLYILSTLHRDSEQATAGGLTYFLLGGLSSCFILLGSGLIYINTGTTSLDGIYIISTISDIASNVDLLYCDFNGLLNSSELNPSQGSFNLALHIYDSSYINISLIILTVGFLFKVSAAPFHF